MSESPRPATGRSTPVSGRPSRWQRPTTGRARPSGSRTTTPSPAAPGPSASRTPGTAGCSITSNVLDCTYATMAVGSVTISLGATTNAAGCGAHPNTVTVNAAHDTNAGDNSASFTDHVICPDVRVTKTGNGTINAGATATFTITVTNDGPGTAF